jgi:hypothetical protein
MFVGQWFFSFIGATLRWILHGFRKPFSKVFFGPDNDDKVFTYYMHWNAIIGLAFFLIIAAVTVPLTC